MYMFFIYICSHNLKHGERRQKSRLKAEYFNVVYSYCVPMCLRITANIETLQCILNLYYSVSNFIFYILLCRNCWATFCCQKMYQFCHMILQENCTFILYSCGVLLPQLRLIYFWIKWLPCYWFSVAGKIWLSLKTITYCHNSSCVMSCFSQETLQYNCF